MRATDLIFGDLRDDITQGLARSSSAVNSSTAVWRGMNNDGTDESSVRKIRQNRNARDSSLFGVYIFDTYMRLKGFPFRKSNTLSVSLSEDQAAEYGSRTFRIYPFDGAQYLHSDEVYDMAEVTTRIRNDFFRLKGPELMQFVNPVDSEGAELADLNQLTGYRLTNSITQLYNRDQSNDFGVAEHIESRMALYESLLQLRTYSDLSQIEPNHLKAVGEVLVFGTSYVALNLRDQMTMEYHRK